MSIAPSHVEEPVRRIKHAAVLELYLRSGPFWDAVSAVRSKWGLTPIIGLPPDQLPAPPQNHDFNDKRYGQWHSDVKRLALMLGRRRFYGSADWDAFAAACVLYDPPEGRGMLTFAQYGGVHYQRADRPLADEKNPRDEGMWTVGPPVKWAKNEAQLQMKLQRYYEGIIEGLLERYVEPTGKDGWEAREEIVREKGLKEVLAAPVDREPVLVPDRYANNKELTDARAASLGNADKGRPPRDDLVAVVCAFLQDEDNATSAEDRRVRRHTNKKLAQEFAAHGVTGERSARGHVEAGRALREIRARNLRES